MAVSLGWDVGGIQTGSAIVKLFYTRKNIELNYYSI